MIGVAAVGVLVFLLTRPPKQVAPGTEVDEKDDVGLPDQGLLLAQPQLFAPIMAQIPQIPEKIVTDVDIVPPQVMGPIGGPIVQPMFP